MKTVHILLLTVAAIAFTAPSRAEETNAPGPHGNSVAVAESSTVYWARVADDAQNVTPAPVDSPAQPAPASPASSGAEDAVPPQPQAAIIGTATDLNSDTVPGATVVLEGPAPKDHRTVVANDNGFYEIKNLEPGIPYHVTISASGFADWNSPVIVLQPRQFLILTGSTLRVAQAETTVNVAFTPVELAIEQVKLAETQRVLGIVPNFYVVYDHEAVPLTAKLKFKLALKVSTDPFYAAGVAVLAGINQAADTPDYVQGARGYGERFGAAAADGLSDIMIGGALLPSLLHQDPRYFYQGTGTKKSRALHALSSPFICKGDNGHQQPNYSSVGGDLASAALSNVYYPASNRGVGLIFGNFLVSTGERLLSTVVQEFVLGKLTTHANK